FWWGSVFLINVPVIVAVVGLGAWLLPESRSPVAGRIDLLSALLSVLAVVPVVFAIRQLLGGGAGAPALLAALVGAVAAVVFVRRQRRLVTPLIDVDLFRIPAFSGAIAANGLSIFAFLGMLYFFSQYLQLVRDFSPFVAGLSDMASTLNYIILVNVGEGGLARLG